jgi:hypothetical protein
MDAFRLMAIVIGLANVGLLALLVLRFRDFEQRFFDKILRSLQTIEKQAKSTIGTPSMTHHHRGGASAKGEFFVCWQWQDDGWKCQREQLPRGAQAGQPPSFPGKYAGQIVKTWVGVKA